MLLTALMVGIVLFYALILFCFETYRLRNQFLRPSLPFTGIVPFYFHNPKGGKLAFWTIIPRSLLASLLWPVVVSWFRYLHFALDLKSIDQTSEEGMRKYTTKLTRHAADNFLTNTLLSSTFIILVLALAVFAEWARPPILIWLALIWIALLLWLLSAFLPHNSINTWIRNDPENLKHNAISLGVLFGFIFPAISSVIALGYSGTKFGFSEVLVATVRIYWLDGVIWEGPKLALGVVRE